MKMWMYFGHRYSNVRTSGYYKINLGKFGQSGTRLAHSIGFWTNPGFVQMFREDMYTYLHSRRYELEPIDYINWSTYARDFATGLIDFTNMWLPTQNYKCRPLALVDERTLKQDSAYSQVRYPNNIYVSMGIHMSGYNTIYDPDTAWYMFDEKFWQDGHGLAFNALENVHAGIPGIDTPECNHPDMVRKSYDVRGITLNVDMNNMEDGVGWLMDLNDEWLNPLFPTKKAATKYIERHWTMLLSRDAETVQDDHEAEKPEL